MLSIYSKSLIQALHDYVTKTRTIAEACQQQGNHLAVEYEIWPVICVMEALWGAGDQAFATEDKMRHLYVMCGLALCDSVSIVSMNTIIFPLVWEVAL